MMHVTILNNITHFIQNSFWVKTLQVFKLGLHDLIGKKAITLCKINGHILDCCNTQITYFQSGLDPTNLYRRATQRITFTTLLGSQQLAEQYIHLTNDYFLSKGHLVAKADFLHGAHQMATFWYINAAPQWQTFNGNNWNSLENDVRIFASRINKDLDCYTGTYVSYFK